MMNHLDDLDPKRGISWQTVQYMLGQVIKRGNRVESKLDLRSNTAVE